MEDPFSTLATSAVGAGNDAAMCNTGTCTVAAVVPPALPGVAVGVAGGTWFGSDMSGVVVVEAFCYRAVENVVIAVSSFVKLSR